jgi:hypothetical protein
VIQIEEVCQFIDWHKKPIIAAREIIDAGYMQKIGLLCETDTEIEMRGLCIQVSHPTENPFEPTATISKPFPGHVLRAYCNCTGGSSGKCKHVVAMLRCVEK